MMRWGIAFKCKFVNIFPFWMTFTKKYYEEKILDKT
jgi:hypothetical protein